jgi:hypothetical protein
MSNLLVSAAFCLAPFSIFWGATAMANGNGAEAIPEDHIAQVCEIRVDQNGESIVLEGLVFASADVSGSYHMQVRQNGLGSSRISQSGEFNSLGGSIGSLGVVSLVKSAGSYVATLTVSWDDGTPDCVAQAPKTRKARLLGKRNASGASEAPSAPVQPDHGTSDPD